jgi:Fe(3+) dicitrate transport protein
MRIIRKEPTMPHSRLLALTVSGIALLPPVQAQTPTDSGRVADTTVIVIGQRVNLLGIPGSGQTIEEQDLVRARVFTVNEALRTVPGVYPRDEEGLGLRPNIGIRGLLPTRSTKVLLLEDGIPLAFAPYGDNASYYHPPIGRFSRIEILKGASQVRFGPQTIGGVINYITPRAPDEATARLRVAGGNDGYLEFDASAGGPLAGGRMLVHANHKEGDGSRDNHALKFTDLSWKGEWDISSEHALTLRASLFTEDSQVSYSGLTLAEFIANPRGNDFRNDRFETERLGLSATHRWDASETVSLLTSAYFSSFDRDWWRQSSNSAQRPADSSDPACGGMANIDTTCGNEGRLRNYDTWGIETRLTFDHATIGLGGETEVGVRYHDEVQERRQWHGDTPTARTPGTGVNAGVRENQQRTTHAWSAFVRSRFVFGDVSVEPGVRVEWIDYGRTNRLNASSGASTLDVVVPGIGVTYALRDDLVVYAGVHKGFAPPRAEDIISAAGGSIDLDAEESVNWELGVRGTLSPGLTLDSGLFRMDFENQIVPASVAGGVGAALTSAGETVHTGAELLVSFSARDAALLVRDDIYARLNATWIWEADFVGARTSNVSGFGSVSVSGNRLPYAPEWLVAAMIGYSYDDLVSVQAEVVYTDDMFTDDLNTIQVIANGQRGLIESAAILNLTLNVTPPETPWGAYIALKNATDELYVVDRSRGILPGPGRLVQAGVTFSF